MPTGNLVRERNGLGTGFDLLTKLARMSDDEDPSFMTGFLFGELVYEVIMPIFLWCYLRLENNSSSISK